MRKILQLFFAFSLMLVMCPRSVMAQDRLLTGTVTTEDNKTALHGVTIRVKGTRKITQTDANGQFKIRVVPVDVLVFTYVGYQPIEISVGNDATVTIKMKTAENILGDVVVTAMDIRRSAKELGYSVQKISGKDIQETQRENFVNGLQGRVAGLTVTPTSGAAGASSTINLRGFNSSANNQPLFIVDGIIIDNQTVDENSNSGSTLGLASDRPNRSSDYTNRIADLNPNDIESITVLKGPEATALYGSQASSGAIVITTKKPTLDGNLTIMYDNSFRISRLTHFPKLFEDFGPGTNGIASTTTFTDFGPKLPATAPRFDNLHHFFKTGFAQTHNLNLNWGKKNVGFRFSGSYFDQDAVVPNNTYQKINGKLTNILKFGQWMDINTSVSYTHSVNDKPVRGSGGFLFDLFTWPVTNDVTNYQDKNGHRVFALASKDPSLESDNPIFNAMRNYGEDKTDRVVGTVGIDIRPTSWLTVSGRFGYDYYKTYGFQLYSPESSTGVNNFGTTTASYILKGALDNYWRTYNGYNHTIYASAQKKVGLFIGRLMLGTMWQDYKTGMFAITGTKLIDSSRTDSSNTDPLSRSRLLQNNFGKPNLSILREIAYFGEASISYKDLIFFSYTRRYESASVFPVKNRNYHYPGASVSVILSDIFPSLKTGKLLSYLKLRGSLANTARLPDPYLNQSVFTNNFASSSVPGYAYGFSQNNPELSPERQRTYEVGTEIRLFKNMIGIDAAYYNTYCYNQISQNARASYATGFVLNTLNAASLRNQGLEITLDAAPVRSKDWNWSMKFNFNHTWSNVISLPVSIAPLNDYYNSDNWILNARGGFVRGHPTTTITGLTYLRNNAGQILINPSTGLPLLNGGTFFPIGDRNPDFTLGWLNNIRYKNWNLSFLWDLKVGGDIFNGTNAFLTLIGKSQLTADRMVPRVIQGVLNDGLQNTANPTANTIVVTPYFVSSSYYYANTPTSGIPEEDFIEHDVNWFRLRDITLSYTLPANLTHRIAGMKLLSVFVTGNDLILWTNYGGADPAVSGTSAATRGVGSFGYDYGNLPTPLQLNFGLRATF